MKFIVSDCERSIVLSKSLNSVQVDTRNWSLSRRTLYEVQLAKQSHRHHRRRLFFVLVALPDQSRQWYRLPRDVQQPFLAYRKTHPTDWKEIIEGALINVPVSRYLPNREPKITNGQVIAVKFCLPSHVDSHRTTRSQFVQPRYVKKRVVNQGEMINYLKHDYQKANQQRIAEAVKNWVKQTNRSKKKNINWSNIVAGFFGGIAVMTVILAIIMMIK